MSVSQYYKTNTFLQCLLSVASRFLALIQINQNCTSHDEWMLTVIYYTRGL